MEPVGLRNSHLIFEIRQNRGRKEGCYISTTEASPDIGCRSAGTEGMLVLLSPLHADGWRLVITR